jgi:hypothetical protein
VADRDHHVIKKWDRPPDQIEMPVGDGIKRPGVDGDAVFAFHR